MTVYIEKLADSHRYNWVVRVGRGRGGAIKSRHRKKQRAKSRGREIARKRGDLLKEQMQAGYWRTVTSYG